MHLAIVSPFPPNITGIGQYGYRVSGALARSGAFDRITLLTERSPDAKSVQVWNGITVERIWRRDRVNVGWQVTARLLQLRPDVVWYNIGASVFGRTPWANLSGLLSPMLTQLAGQPSVVTLHEMVEQADLHALEAPGGPLAAWGARLLTFLTTRTDVVCVTLRRYADWLKERVPRQGAAVAHIPLSAYDPPEMLPESGGQELLIFATFTPYKGLELLLDAFRELRTRYPTLRLTVAGAEHPRFPGYVDSLRHSFGDHPAIRWLGYVPEPALRDVFSRAALVVLPYAAATGSSSVLHRAVAWGRPVVLSDLPEMHAVVEEENLRAEFFASGDRNGLSAAVERLLADSSLRTAQAYHNYQATLRMTLEDTCRAYLRAFALAISRHRGARAYLEPSDIGRASRAIQFRNQEVR
jgi:glycosyltransferase involved in cell wall biosynthesis